MEIGALRENGNPVRKDAEMAGKLAPLVLQEREVDATMLTAIAIRE
jgi:hypothetical protein